MDVRNVRVTVGRFAHLNFVSVLDHYFMLLRTTQVSTIRLTF